MTKAEFEFDPPTTLPDGWKWMPLEELMDQPKQDIVDGPFGSNLKASEYVEEGIPIARLQNVDRNIFIHKNIKYITREKAEELSRHTFNPGDILITKLGDPLGEACIAPSIIEHGVIVADIVRVRPANKKVDRHYLTYAINSPLVARQFEKHTKGTTRPRVNLGMIRKLPIPVAPRELQGAVVAEIEKQFSRLDEAVANLKRVKANLKRYKAAVLKAAIEGHLIQTNSEWIEIKLSSIAGVVDPQPSHRTPPVVADGIPYVGIGDFTKDGSGRVAVEGARKVSHTVLEEHRARYTLQKGDFVFGKIGTIGRPTRLLPPFEYTLSANVVLIQPNSERVLPEFLFAYMSSPSVATLVQKEAKATTQAAFGIKRIRELVLRLPPLAEQHRIVAEIERCISIAEEAEVQVNANLQRGERLRQSILSRAFSGRPHQVTSAVSAMKMHTHG